MNIADRRREIRLALPECMVAGPRGGSGRILDVCSGGLGVEIGNQCLFARGELHRLVLSDLADSVEVEGTVCWTRSSWRHHRGSQDSQYFQTVGFKLSKLLTGDPGGIWPSLLADLPAAPVRLAPVEISSDETLLEPVAELIPTDQEAMPIVEPPPLLTPEPTPASESVEDSIEEVPPEPIKRPTQPLRMIEPADGSIVSQDLVTVICVVDNPRAVTGIKINGIEATVMKDMGTASVKLDRGMNRILSMVQLRDGSYSTYLLGKIQRAASN